MPTDPFNAPFKRRIPLLQTYSRKKSRASAGEPAVGTGLAGLPSTEDAAVATAPSLPKSSFLSSSDSSSGSASSSPSHSPDAAVKSQTKSDAQNAAHTAGNEDDDDMFAPTNGVEKTPANVAKLFKATSVRDALANADSSFTPAVSSSDAAVPSATAVLGVKTTGNNLACKGPRCDSKPAQACSKGMCGNCCREQPGAACARHKNAASPRSTFAAALRPSIGNTNSQNAAAGKVSVHSDTGAAKTRQVIGCALPPHLLAARTANGSTSGKNGTSTSTITIAPTSSKTIRKIQALTADDPFFWLQKCLCCPLRLRSEERPLLGLLQGALDISEYTDNIDILGHGSMKHSSIHNEFLSFCQCIAGVATASGLRHPDLDAKNVFRSGRFYQKVFEVGRRYKILNPEKMRSTYGKLLHILQDARSPSMQQRLSFDARTPLVTVQAELQRAASQQKANGVPAGGLATAMLNDPQLVEATAVCLHESDLPQGTTMHEFQAHKAESRAALLKRYGQGGGLPPGTICTMLETVLDSLTDAVCTLRMTTSSVTEMIELIGTYFHPHNKKSNVGLAIQNYRGGSRLSHSHTEQFFFVMQTMLLWREVLSNIFQLWQFAEDDFIDGEHYRLHNTGQGLNRVQQSPKLARAMSQILQKVKHELRAPSTGSPRPNFYGGGGYGSSFYNRGKYFHNSDAGRGWIGLSVVHLGDRDVPNALVFIDKYTQIIRILSPIVSIVRLLESIEDPTSEAAQNHEALRALVSAQPMH
eukprot:INCI16287.10.p1 GENE.INCI16287.10~~INCI16287.10.p1  ORF type:complete len:756 (+),score=128.52 INCI16287.10:250-2517(+)